MEKKKVYSKRYVLNYRNVDLDRVFLAKQDSIDYAVDVYLHNNSERPFRFFEVTSEFVDLKNEFLKLL